MTKNEIPAPRPAPDPRANDPRYMIGTCDGCEETRYISSEDGRTLMCDECHMDARETESDKAAWGRQDQ